MYTRGPSEPSEWIGRGTDNGSSFTAGMFETSADNGQIRLWEGLGVTRSSLSALAEDDIINAWFLLRRSSWSWV